MASTADQGSKSKKGVINHDSPIDLVALALQLGATYVARSFSGDKAQLVPLIKGAMSHSGAAFIDVISPCVTFNNHKGSTKSYDYVREHNESVNRLDFWPTRDAISIDYREGEVIDVAQHDGSVLRLRKTHPEYDPLDRVKALAPSHPEWKTKEPFASLLKGDVKAALAGGERSVLEIVLATHTGMTSDEFAAEVKAWIATAKHPVFHQPYTECVYQPMLELLTYLRANGFKTFIVSGGGIEFMRPWTEAVYGIPPEQVIGSSVETKFEIRDGQPVLLRLPKLHFIDDKAGKPVGINEYIGRRPIAAFGNSDGDQQMLEYAQGGSGARLLMLVHHDDKAREFAYDTKSPIGTFSDALMTEAKEKNWTVISMKDDWKAIFAFDQ